VSGVTFSVSSGPAPRVVTLDDPQVVVAGFTGRDRASVEAHISELVGLGVPRPDTVPAFFLVPSALLRVAPVTVSVSARQTSGEAEPVLVRLPSGERFVGVGSDHTDREIERRSLRDSKLACPKIVGRELWPLPDVERHWDELLLLGETGPEAAGYQRAALAELRRPDEILDLVWEAGADAGRALVVFLGTVALDDGFRFDSAFRARLLDPRAGRELVCTYEIAEEDHHAHRS
jgi:4-hydroxyphenylacetate 3-monooxygenase